jgi:cysteine sulfinate desulfinase/cysteine desulfurase-like protein
VLTAIGLARPSARASIRIGLGRDTTLQSIADAASQISGVVAAQRLSPAPIGS